MFSVSSLLQLLSNVLLWDGIVQEDTVRDLGLSKLLNRYLLLNLLNTPPGLDNIEKCNKVKDNMYIGRERMLKAFFHEEESRLKKDYLKILKFK